MSTSTTNTESLSHRALLTAVTATVTKGRSINALDTRSLALASTRVQVFRFEGHRVELSLELQCGYSSGVWTPCLDLNVDGAYVDYRGQGGDSDAIDEAVELNHFRNSRFTKAIKSVLSRYIASKEAV